MVGISLDGGNSPQYPINLGPQDSDRGGGVRADPKEKTCLCIPPVGRPLIQEEIESSALSSAVERMH